MNSLSKKDKAILILSLLLFLLLKCDYGQVSVWGIMMGDYWYIDGSVLLWIFYATVIGTDAAVIAKRPDIYKLTSLISFGIIICVPFVVHSFRDGAEFYRLVTFRFEFGVYAYFFVTAAIFYLVRAKENSKILKLLHLTEGNS